MEPNGETDKEGRGRNASICNVLLGGTTGGTTHWGGDTGLVRGDFPNMAGVHVGFLGKITGQKEKRQRDGTWISEAAEKVLKEAGTQSSRAYIDKRKLIVVELVALRTILEVCDK